MPTLTINGVTINASPGATILEAAQKVGIEIPTLCHHPALEPWGGCRLCIVDITREGWDGWQKMVISCLAAAEEGLIVTTDSARVTATRKVCLDLLLARCPETPLIQKLAAAHGVVKTSYRPNPTPDDCILCALCARVCEAHATSAISSMGRGIEKRIGSFADQPPAACVGCGACVLLCPTGHLKDTRSEGVYRVWNQEFTTDLCQVDESRCLGCGACEEACPFAVPRVKWSVDGGRVAIIPSTACRGCGVCVGACPSGAIVQSGFGFDQLSQCRGLP